MARAQYLLEKGRHHVVGSLGSLLDLQDASLSSVRNACDIVEIRLDLLEDDARLAGPASWSHLSDMPLLFTARRADEGGAPNLSATERMKLLDDCLANASFVDVEVASMVEMRDILQRLKEREIPWIASYHDFDKLPATAVLEDAAARAREAGAAVFKAAARISSTADLTRLANFQLADHGLPVATMGMGPLAPVSRLLCAQCGSVLNYGYLGETATAPGQWDSALLKTAISRLLPFGA